MQPSGYFISPHLVLGAIWVWDPCSTCCRWYPSLQMFLDREALIYFRVAPHSYPVGLTERPFILCRRPTAVRMIFDISSLTSYPASTRVRLLVQLYAELACSLDSLPTDDTQLHWFQRFSIQVESPTQHNFCCNIVWAHATTSNVIQLTHSLEKVANTAFPLKTSKSANAFFRFPISSG